MRVLHCEHQRSWTGQTGRLLDDARELRGAGADVTIFCAPGSKLEARARAIGFDPFTTYLRYRPGPIRALRRAIRSFKPDIIHVHGSRDHICALIASGFTGARIVRTKHNLNPLKSGAFSRMVYGRPATARVVAVCEAVKRTLVASGLPEDQVRVVPGCIDLERWPSRPRQPGDRAKLGLREDGPVFAMVGRLSINKGSAVLFQAIPKVVAKRPDVQFLVVGAGDSWKVHMAEAAQAPIRPNVTLTGFVEDTRPYVIAADALVAPSLKDGLPMTILEAMAMSRPTLGSTAGGIPELIVPGKTGELYPPGDADALAAAILEFAGRPERWQAYGEAARAHAAKFDMRRLGKAMLSVYEEILA
jgi:glycosyltransferase involved in cell wall biosynthesis